MKLRNAQEQKQKNVSKEKVFSLLRSQRLTMKKVPTNQVNSKKRLKLFHSEFFPIIEVVTKTYKHYKKGEETVNTKLISLHSGQKNIRSVSFPL